MSQSNPFAAMFAPPSPAERAAELKIVQGTARAAIPLCEEILIKLRELQEMLPESERILQSRQAIALLAEGMRFRADHLK